MATGTYECRDEAERKAIERAIAFAAEMQALALAAPTGRVLDVCEQQAIDGGRALLRDLLQGAVQSRIDAAEQKKGRPGTARAASGSAPSGAAGVKS